MIAKFAILVCLFIIIHFLTRSFKQWNNKVKRKENFPLDKNFSNYLAMRNRGGIENCSVEKLRVCNLNEPDSCRNCLNAFSRCIHFNKDTPFYDKLGRQRIIPKNVNDHEGYCLAAKVWNRNKSPCNPLHGDVVVIEKPSSELEVICKCKYPGYVGGKYCKEPFVCGGKVRDINVPLNEMECLCSPGMVAKRQNGIPTCTEPILADRHLDSVIYEQDYNLKQPVSKTVLFTALENGIPLFDRINNPCSICPITKMFVNGKVVNTSKDEQTKPNYECICSSDTPWFGVPVRLNSSANNRLLKGNRGPDAILGIYFKAIYVYGRVEKEGNVLYVVVFDYENGKNAKFFNSLKLNKEKEYFIKSTNHEFVWPGSFNPLGNLFDRVPFFECVAHAVFYDGFYNPDSNIAEMSKEEWPSQNSQATYSVSFKPIAEAPKLFLWGLDDWNHMKQKFSKPFQFKKLVGREKLCEFLEPEVYRDVGDDIARRLKYLFCAIHRDEKKLTFYLASEDDKKENWKTYLNNLYKGGGLSESSA